MNRIILKLCATMRHNVVIVSVLAAIGMTMVSGSVSPYVHADDAAQEPPSPELCDPEGKGSSNFLSFPTWYRGLSCDTSGKLALKSTSIGMVIMTVGLNVIDMMLRLVAMITIVFLVWGGIQYMMSRGEPAKSATAQKTITGAIIGLIIAIVSVSIVTFVVKGINK